MRKKKYTFLGVDILGITAESRANPRIFQCTFLHLRYLRDVLLHEINILPIKDKKNEQILIDVGSGDEPPYQHFFNGKVGKILTIDPHTYSVNIKASIENIPLPSNSVDYVLATQVFEHVADPQRASREVLRILKKGGKAFISTHGLWSIHRLPKDYWRFTPDSFNLLFHDFKTIRIVPNGGSIICIGQLINLAFLPLFRHIFKLPLIIFWFLINILFLILDILIPRDNHLIINYLVILEK